MLLSDSKSPQSRTEITSFIVDESKKLWEQACSIYQLNPNEITVYHQTNLRGRSAGQCHYLAVPCHVTLRYNLAMAIENGIERFYDTIPHEVSHGIVNLRYKRRKTIRPHGVEWQKVMLSLGFDPKTTHKMNVAKTVNGENYYCDCPEKIHQVSLRRHNMILKGKNYQCRYCKQLIGTRSL
jgi:SprT protein